MAKAAKDVASKVGLTSAPTATASSVSDLEDDAEYSVDISRAVRLGRGRPLLPQQDHIITGKGLKELLANSENDGALSGITKIEPPKPPEA
jgi:hypothetical protein